MIKQTYLINSTLDEVWQALVNPKYINAWGGGPVKMNEKKGTKFELWGGDIHGKNIEVVPLKKLVQEWYGGKWEKPSVVTFTLTKDGNKTKLNLLQTDVPDNEVKDIDDGWKEYYLGPMKEYLEKK
ncbi:MAG: Activator of Hsp90 ATPase 1 family protein [Candidatus Levybacteria bacterium]|nr:Activator of Hsp90 ATPase 1 family protein [Candidatus Levybacteria bacterium]